MENSLKGGVCPKCRHKEVYRATIEEDKVLPHVFYTFAPQSRPMLDNYVCGNCGYTEFYVTAGEIEKVKKNWLRLDNLQPKTYNP